MKRFIAIISLVLAATPVFADALDDEFQHMEPALQLSSMVYADKLVCKDDQFTNLGLVSALRLATEQTGLTTEQVAGISTAYGVAALLANPDDTTHSEFCKQIMSHDFSAFKIQHFIWMREYHNNMCADSTSDVCRLINDEYLSLPMGE
jgi:hypothetical protein